MKTHPSVLRAFFRASLLTGLLLGAAAHGVERTWIGPSSGSWHTSSYWNPAGIPVPEDSIIISNSAVTLSAPVTISNQMNWGGGTLSGQRLTIAPSATLTLSGSLEKCLAGMVLNNYGRVVWGGTGRIFCNLVWGGWATVSNQAGGTFEVATDAPMEAGSGSSPGTFLFENLGTVLKSAGVGSNVISGAIFNNRGLVELQVGNLELSRGGVMAGEVRVPAGSRLTFNGGGYTLTTNGYFNAAAGGLVEYRSGSMSFDPGLAVAATTSNWVSGTVSFSGLVNLPNFELRAGNLGGTFTNSGGLRWTGGVLSGAITIGPGGLLSLEGAAEKQLAGAVLNNYGRVVWGGTGRVFCNLIWGGWATVSNQAGGTFEVATDAPMEAGSGSSPGTFLFENLGTVLKSAGVGSNVISGAIFNNRGLVEVGPGTIRFAGNVLFLPGSVWSVVVGGNVPGLQFGQVLVDGTATLAGTIAARLTNGFLPEIGQTYQILRTGVRSGTFDNTGLSYLGDRLGFLSLYSSSGLSIQVQRPVTAWPIGLRAGRFHFLVSGNVGTTYVIQSTSDFETWTDLLVTNLTVSSFDFVDADTNTYPHRFYRVKPLP